MASPSLTEGLNIIGKRIEDARADAKAAFDIYIEAGKRYREYEAKHEESTDARVIAKLDELRKEKEQLCTTWEEARHLLEKYSEEEISMMHQQHQPQREGEESGSPAKRQKSSNVDRIKQAQELANKIKQVDIEETKLALPNSVPLVLPYPNLATRVPDRISVDGGRVVQRSFHFMGRERIVEIVSGMDRLLVDGRTVEARRKKSVGTTSIVFQSQYNQMLVYGSPGWGKSYIFSALAVVLLRDFFNNKSELRVVYLPDCRQLLTDLLEPLQLALLLAFADSEDECRRIQQAKTGDELIAFSKHQGDGTLLFIVDQYNALTAVPGGKKKKKKEEAETLIESCARNHFIIRAISINDDNKLEVEQKQMSRLVVPLFAGTFLHSPCSFWPLCVQTELEAWFEWQKDKLPKADTDNMSPEAVKDLIASESGSNLLFLQPFLRPLDTVPGNWTLNKAVVAFRQSKEVVLISQSLRALLEKLLIEGGERRVQQSLALLVMCVNRCPLEVPLSALYDARYFYFIRQTCADVDTSSSSSVSSSSSLPTHKRVASQLFAHTIGLVVDRCVALLVREYKQSELLTQPSWRESIEAYASHPIMMGFLVEQAVLSYLSQDETLRQVLSRLSITLPEDARPTVHLFDERSETSAMRAECVAVYIPKSFNYPSVDAVIHIIHRSAPGVIVGAAKDTRSTTSQLSQSAPVTTTLTVIPIQITMREIDNNKRNKSLAFFARRQLWTSDLQLPSDNIKYCFIFIGGASGMTLEDKPQQLYGAVTYHELCLRLDEISLPLATAVRKALTAK